MPRPTGSSGVGVFVGVGVIVGVDVAVGVGVMVGVFVGNGVAVLVGEAMTVCVTETAVVSTTWATGVACGTLSQAVTNKRIRNKKRFTTYTPDRLWSGYMQHTIHRCCTVIIRNPAFIDTNHI